LFNPNSGHIYESGVTGVLSSSDDAYFPNKHLGLPVVPTIPFRLVDDEFDEALEYLGGFPMVVKINGSQNGVGVMKLDSKSSLRSVLDYLSSYDSDIWLRKFISHIYQARVIVVGDKVVGGHKNFPVKDDFRTNVTNHGERQYESATFPEEMENVAIRAVHSSGRYYGGVDLLVTETEEFYIAEVNTPCAFGLTERVTGQDIAGPLIDFLISRAGTAQ